MKRLTSRHSKKAGLPPGSLVHIGDIIPETLRITLLEYDESRIAEPAIGRHVVSRLGVCRMTWMLAIMVGFTSLALWLLSQSNA